VAAGGDVPLENGPALSDLGNAYLAAGDVLAAAQAWQQSLAHLNGEAAGTQTPQHEASASPGKPTSRPKLR
jgi:hypothetical protein